MNNLSSKPTVTINGQEGNIMTSFNNLVGADASLNPTHLISHNIALFYKNKKRRASNFECSFKSFYK